MPEPRIPGGTERGLRLILASRALDPAYARHNRLRSTLILAFAPDPVLDRFNEWTYGRAGAYEPGRLSSGASSSRGRRT